MVIRTPNQRALPVSEPSPIEAGESSPEQESSRGEPSQDVAAYLARMTGEMATMARAANYDLLAYFLEMARIEANVQVEQQAQK